MIKINERFKTLIPPLDKEEYVTLEKSILENGVTNDIQTWNDFIIDGHNRYEICNKHNIKYGTKELLFETEEDVMIYIIDNQMGRRNIGSFVKLELQEEKEIILKKKAKENYKVREEIKQQKASLPELVKMDFDEVEDFLSDRISKEREWNEPMVLPTIKPINTQKEIAKAAGVSHGTKYKFDKIKDVIDDTTREKLRKGEIKIDKVFNDIKKEEVLSTLKAKEVAPPTGKYDVIVLDPPWDMVKIDREVSPEQIGFDYPTMSYDEIKAFKLPAEKDCHVFCWTTQKHLPETFEIFKSWGVKYVFTMVWHKNGGFQPFNLPQYNCEFILYGHIGSPIFTSTKAFNTCFNADRKGHSVKPDYFYELLNRITSGKRIDIFNRRKIDGFDTWGDQAQ